VMSLLSVAFLGSTPVGGPLVGFIAGELGARYGLGVGGVAALLAALYGWSRLSRGFGPGAGGPVATVEVAVGR
jgi:hypothetical protein